MVQMTTNLFLTEVAKGHIVIKDNKPVIRGVHEPLIDMPTMKKSG